MACLWDELASLDALKMHLHRMRTKIRPEGLDITTEMMRGYAFRYRLVRLLNSPANGKR